MDELRIEIFDLLYRTNEPKTIGEVAESVNQDSETIRAAIDHEWFRIIDDMVTIAHGAPSA